MPELRTKTERVAEKVFERHASKAPKSPSCHSRGLSIHNHKYNMYLMEYFVNTGRLLRLLITHYSQLQLNTVSVQGVKQVYHDQLRFPIVYESTNEICFQPTPYFKLLFKEAIEPVAPAHFAFEVPYSEFENVVHCLNTTGITLLKWPDGRVIDDFETGKNVYFRDGDGNLLEMITHSYVREGIVPPSGDLKILYLREIGFPVDSVVDFRELLVQIFNMKLDKVSDHFTFAVSGTSHVVIPSKKRKWIPIAMTALQPSMHVAFGVSSSDFLEKVKTILSSKGIQNEYSEQGFLHFTINGYNLYLSNSEFSQELPMLLNLPLSR